MKIVTGVFIYNGKCEQIWIVGGYCVSNRMVYRVIRHCRNYVYGGILDSIIIIQIEFRHEWLKIIEIMFIFSPLNTYDVMSGIIIEFLAKSLWIFAFRISTLCLGMFSWPASWLLA